MNKLSRKDIEMLEMLATTTESDDKLAEYIHYHKKAVKAYKAFREAVVNGVEVDKVEKVVEAKRKFKAGDKVRVLDTESAIATAGLRIGDVAEVFKYNSLLGDGVVELKTPGRTRWAYFGESSLELVEEKTNNELRKEVIQKAKDFLEESKNDRGSYSVPFSVAVDLELDYKVTEGGRLVIVFLAGFHCKEVISSGLYEFPRNEVCNEHIGKAIALGRALGQKKNVREFENAVQPSELVVGMVIRRNYFNSTDTYEREVEKIEGEVLHYTGGRHDLRISDADNLTIIDDTNAIYEEGIE